MSFNDALVASFYANSDPCRLDPNTFHAWLTEATVIFTGNICSTVESRGPTCRKAEHCEQQVNEMYRANYATGRISVYIRTKTRFFYIKYGRVTSFCSWMISIGSERCRYIVVTSSMSNENLWRHRTYKRGRAGENKTFWKSVSNALQQSVKRRAKTRSQNQG